jgi:hypothetical protein
MFRAFWRFGTAAVLAGALVGCSARPIVQQKPPPPDPLLVTRKPIEGKPRAEDAELSARLQPPQPPATAGDLASGPLQEGAIRPAQLQLEAPRADGPR